MEVRGKVFTLQRGFGCAAKAPAVTTQMQRKSNTKGRSRRSEGWQEEPAGKVRQRSKQDQVEAGDSTDILENRRAFREQSQGHIGSTFFLSFFF